MMRISAYKLKSNSVLLLVAPITLAGCSFPKPVPDILKQNVVSVGNQSVVKPSLEAGVSKPGKPVAPGAPVLINATKSFPIADLRRSDVQPGGAGFQTDEQDHRKKADVYWKLNWLRRELLNSHVPEDFEPVLEHIRTEIQASRNDANYNLTMRIIKDLDAGLKFFRMAHSLSLAHINPASIPWAGTPEEIEKATFPLKRSRSEDSSSSGHTPTSDDEEDDNPVRQHTPTRHDMVNSLSLQDRENLDLVQKFAAEFRIDPVVAMRASWRNAINGIYRLRDDLKVRPQVVNSDPDRCEIPESIVSSFSPAPAGSFLPQTRTGDPIDGP